MAVDDVRRETLLVELGAAVAHVAGFLPGTARRQSHRRLQVQGGFSFGLDDVGYFVSG
jgi:hypothetical protein